MRGGGEKWERKTKVGEVKRMGEEEKNGIGGKKWERRRKIGEDGKYEEGGKKKGEDEEKGGGGKKRGGGGKWV